MRLLLPLRRLVEIIQMNVSGLLKKYQLSTFSFVILKRLSYGTLSYFLCSKSLSLSWKRKEKKIRERISIDSHALSLSLSLSLSRALWK